MGAALLVPVEVSGHAILAIGQGALISMTVYLVSLQAIHIMEKAVRRQTVWDVMRQRELIQDQLCTMTVGLQ